LPESIFPKIQNLGWKSLTSEVFGDKIAIIYLICMQLSVKNYNFLLLLAPNIGDCAFSSKLQFASKYEKK